MLSNVEGLGSGMERREWRVPTGCLWKDQTLKNLLTPCCLMKKHRPTSWMLWWDYNQRRLCLFFYVCCPNRWLPAKVFWTKVCFAGDQIPRFCGRFLWMAVDRSLFWDWSPKEWKFVQVHPPECRQTQLIVTYIVVVCISFKSFWMTLRFLQSTHQTSPRKCVSCFVFVCSMFGLVLVVLQSVWGFFGYSTIWDLKLPTTVRLECSIFWIILGNPRFQRSNSRKSWRMHSRKELHQR